MIVVLGTELKLNINIQPIDGLTMDDYNFEVEAFVYERKSVRLDKQNCVKVDSNNYIARIDTNVIGTGDVTCRVTADIPDADFHDGLRKEVVAIDTGVRIVR